MNAEKVQIQQEIFRNDASKIIHWLQDDTIVKYLNEDQNVTHDIKQVMNRVNMPVLTHLFNRNGSFFLVTTRKNEPIGFLRLVPKKNGAEMVVVIGEREKWGQGLGTSAILQGLNHAFFNWRVKKVTAKINTKNTRSIKVFKKVGFKLEKELPVEKQYCITMDDYIKRIS